MTNLSSSLGVHPFDWVEDVVFILDTEYRFTFVNASALNAWNKHPHELLGQTYGDALPAKASRAVSEIRSTLEAGRLTLGIVLEARDLETQGHTTRAATMAAQLGECLGLTRSDLCHLR